MAKNIDTEIQRLLTVKEEIDAFNIMKKWCSKTVPISQSKYNELVGNNCLDEEAFYYIFDKDIGQYIDGYME